LGAAVGDRVQPLLVGLQSADQATDLIQRATQLRRSADELVRKSVYINRNLTATEARLAYEERCRHRRRRSNQHQAGHQRSTDDQAAGDTISAVASLSTTQTAESSHLNPLTPSFTPLVVSADVHHAAE